MKSSNGHVVIHQSYFSTNIYYHLAFFGLAKHHLSFIAEDVEDEESKQTKPQKH